MHVSEIRELAKKFAPEQIENCITQQMQEGMNICDISGPTEHVISELAKASLVRDLTDKGMSLNDAVRELAKRIRLVQMAFKEED
ncbi:MAG TPA: hypothetical protein DHV16_07515 [Nitrospiraceae bacterium]|nr:MAG: hypothetical protein A2Z82_01560 [Nitrospirae bacterium GWA2_46_11]OGW25669.1 MAG: hypothetical protein A2X55_05135 [Nitrospirae bacterium GWB2_47_37]HAK88698.1 hypothetical protein [Nitrospiraceae bacterium]HCZ12087.1 hypothetical protein [Nitrospiraceae bacterium]